MNNHVVRRGAKRRLLAVGGLAGLIGTAGIAHARQATPVLSIFQGTPAQSSGLTLSSWGSGSITEDQKTVYSGTESLRIITHGQYQGALLHLSKPVDLSNFVADKSAYLQIAVLLPAPPGSGGGNSGGGPGGPGGAGGLGPPGSGGPSGFGRPSTTTNGKTKAIDNVRVVLNRANGRATEFVLPVSSGVTDNQWRLLSVPVSMIPGVTANNAKFTDIRLFGDNPGVMYVGRIGVVLDANPIKVEPVTDMSVGVRNRYRYTASASAGPTPLKYSWDWDEKDGIQDESVGRAVEHIYYHEGDYVGTLTVSDIYGVKSPVSTKFKIHVHL